MDWGGEEGWCIHFQTIPHPSNCYKEMDFVSPEIFFSMLYCYFLMIQLDMFFVCFVIELSNKTGMLLVVLIGVLLMLVGTLLAIHMLGLFSDCKNCFVNV